MIREQIEEKLRTAFLTVHLKVHDESYRHNLAADTESHFKIIIVSDKFDNQPVVSRHRAIYNVLSEELSGRVHALALHSYTRKEWELLENEVPPSPNCCCARYITFSPV